MRKAAHEQYTTGPSRLRAHHGTMIELSFSINLYESVVDLRLCKANVRESFQVCNSRSVSSPLLPLPADDVFNDGTLT